jgi:hypothetical protein
MADRPNNRERQEQAWAARLAGATYVDIGRALGVSRQRAQQLCTAAMKERMPSTEDVEAYRQQEAERIDRLHRAVWKQAIDGNHGAIDRVLRLSERRARLLGLDAPQRQEITGADGGPLEIDVGAALAAALARLG